MYYIPIDLDIIITIIIIVIKVYSHDTFMANIVGIGLCLILGAHQYAWLIV